MAVSAFDLPPGFRFHPTDEELVAFYLQRKVSGKRIEWNVIAEIDLYKHDPWDLPGLSCLPTKDSEWYFFNPPDKKYPRGSRTNRATKSGYWKATGKDRKVFSNSKVVGMKKTLVFYKGRAPNGERTDWVMHEYQLVQQDTHPAGDTEMRDFNDALVLCRVMKKSGPGPRSRNPQLQGGISNNAEHQARISQPTTTILRDVPHQWSQGCGAVPIRSVATTAMDYLPTESAESLGMCTDALNIAKERRSSSHGWLPKLNQDQDYYFRDASFELQHEDSGSEVNLERDEATFDWDCRQDAL